MYPRWYRRWIMEEMAKGRKFQEYSKDGVRWIERA